MDMVNKITKSTGRNLDGPDLRLKLYTGEFLAGAGWSVLADKQEHLAMSGFTVGDKVLASLPMSSSNLQYNTNGKDSLSLHG